MSDDFFGDLGKSITRATQKAAMRTGSLIESTKINAMITAESKAIEKLYLELGELVYEQYDGGEIKTSSQMSAIVDELDMHLEKISSYRTELAEVKGMRVCPSCGEIIEMDALFCPKCGVSAVTGEAEEKPVPEEEQEEDLYEPEDADDEEDDDYEDDADDAEDEDAEDEYEDIEDEEEDGEDDEAVLNTEDGTESEEEDDPEIEFELVYEDSEEEDEAL